MPSLQIFHRSTVKTESINRASDQVRHELGCTLTNYSLWLAISDIETKISHNNKGINQSVQMLSLSFAYA